jgi:SOS-response transcriptional repressor LexA
MIDNKDLLMMKMMHDGNPSIHEMREAIRARSTGTVAARLKTLEERGYVIQPSVRQPRSRTVTESGLNVLRGAKIISDETV